MRVIYKTHKARGVKLDQKGTIRVLTEFSAFGPEGKIECRLTSWLPLELGRRKKIDKELS